MIYNLANILVKKMLAYNLIKNDVQEYYKYSIQIHIERFIGFSLLLFISVFCGLMYETVFFYIFFFHISENIQGDFMQTVLVVVYFVLRRYI